MHSSKTNTHVLILILHALMEVSEWIVWDHDHLTVTCVPYAKNVTNVIILEGPRGLSQKVFKVTYVVLFSSNYQK